MEILFAIIWIIIGCVIGIFLVSTGVSKWQFEAAAQKGIVSTLSLTVKHMNDILETKKSDFNDVWFMINKIVNEQQQWFDPDEVLPDENRVVLVRCKGPGTVHLPDLAYMAYQETQGVRSLRWVTYKYHGYDIVGWTPIGWDKASDE